MAKPKGANTYTAEQFINAIPGTGGIKSQIAKKVGCHRGTAAKFIDNHPTVYRAWEDERFKISDIAQNQVIKAIMDGDIQTCKWWLQLMDPEFVPVTRQEISGVDGEPILIKLDR
jgi:hypothetical protein